MVLVAAFKRRKFRRAAYLIKASTSGEYKAEHQYFTHSINPLGDYTHSAVRSDCAENLCAGRQIHHRNHIPGCAPRKSAPFGQDGQPFLRLGPQGAEANTRHPDWLKTYLPGGMPGRKPETGKTPLWKSVRSSPTWGWFDARLQPAGHKVGASWRIPVLLDGKASEIKGSFQATLQSGYWQASWTRLPTLPAGVNLMLIPGQPYGLMLSNQSPQPVTVLGRQGEPFIRVSAQGTEAYLASPLWQETASQQGLRQSKPGDAASPWRKLNSAQRHTWIEPRTRGRNGQTQPLRWEIQLQVGSQRLVAQGISRWVSKR